MDYRGIVIEESLVDAKVLQSLTIVNTAVESVTEGHRTPWLKRWTMHTVSVPEEKIRDVAAELSQVLEGGHSWYADLKNDRYHFIVFHGKVFCVDRRNPDEYEKARQYGVSVGVPEHQLDFGPDTKEWER